MRVKTAAFPTLIVALVALFALGACGGGDEKESLVIAIQPSATQGELSDQAAELEAFLEERTGADVEIRFPTSYGGVIESLRFGHADAAFMGAWPAALAVEKADAEVALAEVREVIIGDDSAQEPYYYSYWVVKKDSPYQSLEELRGRSAAFPSQLSTSGYVAPMARLQELGLIDVGDGESADPRDFFGDVFFAGGYSQAWEALQSGQVDVSVIAGDVPEDLYREVLDNTRVIEQQGPIPSHSVVYSNSLEEPLRGKLTAALLELGDDEHRELMRKFVSGIFVRFEETTSDKHLGELSRYLDETGLTFTESFR